MATSERAFEDALHTWATWATGLAGNKVIFAKQAAPRPAMPYVTIATPATLASIGQAALVMPDADSPSYQADVLESATFTVYFRAFGATAFDLLNQARLRLYYPLVSDYLRRAQVTTFAVTKATTGEEYSVFLEGIECAVTAAAGEDVDDIADALVAKIAASEWVEEHALTASRTAAAGTFTVTSYPGREFVAGTAGALTSTLTQEAYDLAVVEDMGVVDTTLQRETNFEKSAALDVRFATTLRLAIADMETVETVEIEDEDNGSTIIVEKE